MHIINHNNPPPIEELRMSNLAVGKENGRWTWEKKYQVACVYLETGSNRETVRVTGISDSVLDSWIKSPWWGDMLEEIKKANKSALDTKLTKIIHKSLALMEDRLENGEEILNNKTGEIVRKPVGLRDATRAATELMNRKIQMEKNEQEVKMKTQSVTETLQALANEFAKWNNKKNKAEAETIDFIEVQANAVHDQRETGLQEGSGEVYQPSVSNQEAR